MKRDTRGAPIHSQAYALKDFDQAARDIAAGRNVLGGRTDQGMLREVKPAGRIGVRGECGGGYEPTREAAMVAFGKSWRRE
jgi:hypothetical protein